MNPTGDARTIWVKVLGMWIEAHPQYVDDAIEEELPQPFMDAAETVTQLMRAGF